MNIKTNYELFGLKPTVILGDSVKKISSFRQKFDVIYIDPPYRLRLYNPALNEIKKNNILNFGGVIVVEHPKDEEIGFSGFEIIKQKKYADKMITFIQ